MVVANDSLMIVAAHICAHHAPADLSLQQSASKHSTCSTRVECFQALLAHLILAECDGLHNMQGRL